MTGARLALLASLVAAPLPALAAQSPAPAGAAHSGDERLPERRVCFRGRPQPRCDAFWLTELGFYGRAAGTTLREENVDPSGASNSYERRDLENYLAWEFGGMVNRGDRTALGGTVLLGLGGDGTRVGLKGRYRRWLDRGGTAADLSVGVIRANVSQPLFQQDALGVGLTADASLNASDLGAVTVRTDVVRGGGRTAAALYGGVRLGSRPAVVGTAALGAAYLLLLAAFASADY